MSLVETIHGCVPQWRPDAQSHRNYVADADFLAFLSARPRSCGRREAEAGPSPLTVDDGTVGAARACMLAREAGHEVIIFLNPSQISSGRLYWFSRLNAILDATRLRRFTFEGREYELDRGPGTRKFRLTLKARLMGMPEAATDALLEDLARQLEVRSVEVPEHARTLSRSDVRQLVSAGVRIGNHGWDHRDIAAMSAADVAADLRTAAEWFEQSIGVKPVDYAVPYGLAWVPEEAATEVPGTIYLSDPRLDLGEVGRRHWNRRDVTRAIHSAAR